MISTLPLLLLKELLCAKKMSQLKIIVPHDEFTVPKTLGYIPSLHTAFTAVEPTSKRGVSFMPSVRVRKVKKLASTHKDKSRLYYTRSEMHGFYLEVKELHSSYNKDTIPPRECLVSVL